jgi:hypothetical protein
MQEAGVDGKREPPTATVLGGHYTPQQCRALFPKQASKDVQAAIANFRHHLDNKPDEKNRDEYKDWQIKTQVLEKDITERTDNVGRRVDIHATKEDQDGITQERLVDTSLTHPTNKTNITKSAKHAQLCLSQRLGRLDKKVVVPPSGPALRDRTKSKIQTYSTLMAIAEKQYLEKRRLSKPVFVPAIATTHGELGPDLIKLMEWIVAAYKLKMEQAPPRADGRRPAQMTATFRRRLRERVLVAVMKGTARVLRTAGLSKLACRKYA